MKKLPFLESIFLADMEKVHSQIISFVFSDMCTCISKKSKLALLESLFDISQLTTNKIDSYTEYSNIDILIVTDFYVFVIENKLKSNQHSDQLNVYQDKINNDPRFNNRRLCFGFLTYIHEQANDNHDVWINISYEHYYTLLNSIKIKCFDYYTPFIKDYLNYLHKLTSCIALFDSNHRDFPNVFTDVGMSKFDKRNKAIQNNYTGYQLFISHNNLEKILDFRFFKKHIENAIDLNNSNLSYNLSNSGNSGVPTYHINFPERYTFPDAVDNTNLIQYRFGFQYDGRLIKFCFLAVDYDKIKTEQFPQVIRAFFHDILTQQFPEKRFSAPRGLTFMNVNERFNIEEHSTDEIRSKLQSELSQWRDYYQTHILTNFYAHLVP